MSTLPDFSRERALSAVGPVAGVDEAGRGPLAGPVVAGAVILDPDRIPDGLNDSKKLSDKRRRLLAKTLRDVAVVGVGQASVEEIDSINILQAAHLAMQRAVADLSVRPGHVLIDGKHLPRAMNLPMTGIVKGDARCLSIAAASIIAKVVRDDIMVGLAQQHPHYGWERNAGYPTAEHRAALECHGVTPHHRRTFRTVHNIL